jgi:hypothetical protein
MSAQTPEPDTTLEQRHQAAMQNYRKLRRLMQIVGTLFAMIGLAMLFIDFNGDSETPMWYFFLRQMACQFGIMLWMTAILRPRMYPVPYPPTTPEQRKNYGAWLYLHSLRWHEIALMIMRTLLLTTPIILGPAIGTMIWNATEDVGLRMIGVGIAAILIVLGFFALARWVFNPLKRQQVAWLAENYPDSQSTD